MIKFLAANKPQLIPPLIVVIFFCVLIGIFLVIIFMLFYDRFIKLKSYKALIPAAIAIIAVNYTF